jgi:hypothetical protein
MQSEYLERSNDMSYAKLRGKIREVFGTQEAFAVAMGMSTVTLSQKLNGKLEWKTSEIANACDLLGIPLKDNPAYFFIRKVKKS